MSTHERDGSIVLKFKREDTASVTVRGETYANIVSSELICGAVPFHMQPKPDDAYTFTVSKSAEEFLNSIITQVYSE